MSGSVEPLPFNVRGQHKLRAIKHTENEYGRFATKWECVGCGMESTSRRKFEKSQCDDPILWVRLGCPGDGLRVCRDCDTVFVGHYDGRPFYERTCIECDSIQVYRDDDPQVPPELVKGDDL